MRPTGMKVHIQKSCCTECFNGGVLSNGFTTTRYDTKTPFITGMAINRGIDGPIDGLRKALNESVVIPLRGEVSKGSTQSAIVIISLVHHLRPGYDHL